VLSVDAWSGVPRDSYFSSRSMAFATRLPPSGRANTSAMPASTASVVRSGRRESTTANMSVAARWFRISRAHWSAAAPRDRSNSTGMSRRCSSFSAYGTFSAHTTDTFAALSSRSVSARSGAGQPR